MLSRSKHFFHQLHSLTHSHHWNPDIVEYYIFKVFRTIGFALLTLFVPVFLYAEVGYSIFEIMMFFIINQIYFMIFVPFSGKFVEKIGLKHSMIIQFPGFIAFTYGLQFLSGNFIQDLWIIFVILAFRAILKIPFGTAENMFIARNIAGKEQSSGKSLAVLKIVLIFAGLLAPLAGGIISYFWGFDSLFNFAIGIFILASIPLLFGKDQYYESDETVKETLIFTWKDMSKYFHLAEIGKQAPLSLLFIVWPIFIYIIVQNTMNLGILLSLSAGVAMTVSYFIGKFIDKHQPHALLRYGARISGFVFFLRGAFPSPILLAITDMLNNIITPVVDIPYDKKYFAYLNSFKNKNEAYTASVFVAETQATLNFIFLAAIFGVLELLHIEPNYAIFLSIFVVYGLSFLLLENILRVKNN